MLFVIWIFHEDATVRIFSLIEAGGVGDYGEDRGAAASAALDLIVEDPVFGAGVQTIYEMPEGPHNMFLAMMVDYGIFGLIVYLVVIIRLILIARRAGRDLSGTVLFYVAWLVIFSFASHNLLGDTATIPLMGFALARAYRIQLQRSQGELIDDFARRRSLGGGLMNRPQYHPRRMSGRQSLPCRSRDARRCQWQGWDHA